MPVKLMMKLMSIRGSSARSNTLSWLVVVNTVRMSPVRFIKVVRMRGESAEIVLSELACYGIPGITGEITDFWITNTTTSADEITERPYLFFE